MYNIAIPNLLQLAKTAALEAGAAILEVYSAKEITVELKENESPLTLADQAGHNKIVARLQASNIPVLSEEGKDIPFELRSTWDYFWMVDPLDGTKEFIKRNGEFTVNIALIHAGVPILGVVYVPVTGVMYWGTANDGAYKQVGSTLPESITVTGGRLVSAIVASRSHLSPETQVFIDKYPHANCTSMGSSLKLLLVAEGAAQLYPRFAPTMEWDTAAADAVVRAAGGQVVQVPGGMPVAYNKPNLLNPWFLVNGLAEVVAV